MSNAALAVAFIRIAALGDCKQTPRFLKTLSAFKFCSCIVESLLETSSESAMQALANIRSAVGILEVHPLIGRRVDGHVRELVISQGATGCLALYRFDAGFDVVRILGIRHQLEAGYTS